MSDLIDREKLRDDMLSEMCFTGYQSRALNVISEQPTVDAVPVVRCKDCKHCYDGGDSVLYNCCELNHGKAMPDDWFCAGGEPKEANE